MTTSDVERLLTAELHRRAEEAMNQTRTEERLHELMADAERDRRRRRAGWTFGAVAAAAVLAAAVLVLPGLGADDEPSGTASEHLASSPVQVATGFLEAYAAFDRPAAAAYLSDEAASATGWRADNRWFEAVGFAMRVGSCGETTTGGSPIRVDCTFSYSSMHSEDLGRGRPFDGSTFEVVVDGEQVVFFDMKLEFVANGFSKQVWEPFAAWVTSSHPRDAAIMYADWPDTSQQAETPRAVKLWRTRTAEWVAAQE
jgi:hypothetical protein